MDDRELIERLAELNPDALYADGLQAALIGYVERFGQPAVALYDREKCIEVLQEGGMSREQAEEYFEVNVIGAAVGPGTPAFATLVKKDTPE